MQSALLDVKRIILKIGTSVLLDSENRVSSIKAEGFAGPVSYTHLTLPTILLV